jgi:hydrogenase maturation protein HypF
MAAAYLDRDDLAVARRNEKHWAVVQDMARKNINSPLTSSAGRLFDAVAALLGVRDTISYEGQAAIELEQLAAPAERGWYRAGLEQHGVFWINGSDLVRAAAEQTAAGVRREVIAARFHNGVAVAIEAGCQLARERTGLGTVALSGGVFQNWLLLHETVGRLQTAGFRVLTHARVPCNDGGISLGQAVIAGQQLR